MSAEYSVDWFSNNIPTWKKLLARFKGKEVNALEIGSYEGMSASWLLDNILTHPKAKITCIDNFTQKDAKTKKDVLETFQANMRRYGKKCKLLKGDSSVMLKLPAVTSQQYDIIYIDSDHHSRHVMEDAVLCFALLKPGGILIFDDNTDNKEHDNRCPKPAITSFTMAYANEIKVLHSKWQVAIMKRARPLRKTPCYSEFYPHH
jgi:predicted O-methyltransferase YrrM